MIRGYRSLNLFFSKNNFVGSFNEIEKIPNIHLPECCFTGRSNVGKSSMINAITRSKKLAKTSKTPGRTQAINMYEIGNKLNFIDLPGYGYAKLSLSLRNHLYMLLQRYFLQRKNLKKIYVLINSTNGLKNSDIDTFDLITETNRTFAVILTKTDKCSKNVIEKQENSILKFLQNYPKLCRKTFLSSCKNNEGIIDIQKDIYKLTSLS